MVDHTQASKTISLDNYGIKNAKVQYQLSSEELQKITIQKGLGVEASSGALAVNTGEFTGRCNPDPARHARCVLRRYTLTGRDIDRILQRRVGADPDCADRDNHCM